MPQGLFLITRGHRNQIHPFILKYHQYGIQKLVLHKSRRLLFMEHFLSPLQRKINEQLHKINECHLMRNKDVHRNDNPDTASVAVSNSACKVLPFEKLPKKIQMRFRRMGVRKGFRSVQEAKNLYNNEVPSGCKTSVNDLNAFLDDKQGAILHRIVLTNLKELITLNWRMGMPII